MSVKELQERIVLNMRDWQKIEDATVELTGKIMEKSSNPLVRMVMEIVQRDSQTHRRVQELVAATLEEAAPSLSPDELADVWDLIERHIDMEKKTVASAQEALAELKGKKMLVQEYLLNYLQRDEEKHVAMLEALASIQKGMYPYG